VTSHSEPEIHRNDLRLEEPPRCPKCDNAAMRLRNYRESGRYEFRCTGSECEYSWAIDHGNLVELT